MVDDDVALLARLGAQLEASGYTVLRASHIQHAEQLLDEQRPDLIVLDTASNRGAGWDLLERMAPMLPVLVVSGDGMEEHIIRGLDAGAADYLPKPVRTGELLARIRARLRTAPHPSSAHPAPSGKSETIAPQEQASSPAARLRQQDAEAVAPVFIPYGEEQRLLHETGASATASATPHDPDQRVLGGRLRAARQRKGISLVQAEHETRMRMYYIQAIEEEKFSLLPRGPLAEELLRTYVNFLGLDVSQALDEYRRLHYNPPIEPPLALGSNDIPRRPRRLLMRLAAIALALIVGMSGLWVVDPDGIAALADRARQLFTALTP